MINSLKILAENRSVRAFCLVFSATALIYRLGLTVAIWRAEAPPLGVAKDFATSAAILISLGNDLLVLLLILFLAFIIVWLRRERAYPGRLVLGIALPLVLFWHGVAMGSHGSLLFTMNTGFTWSMFMEFFTILNLRDFFALLTWRDYLALIVPLAAFVVVFYRNPTLRFKPRTAFVGTAVIGFSLLSTGIFSAAVPDELVLNPNAFLFRDALRHIGTSQPRAKMSPGNELYLSGEVFSNGSAFSGAVPGQRSTDMNVVFIVLESTSSEYIFDTKRYAGGKMPMPFLYELSGKSLYASRHFASNNSSPRSLFSIFSGLYESPEVRFFSMEKKLRVPHLLDHLGGPGTRDAFLVTPADLNWYFPKAWFKNRGFTRLMDYSYLKSIPEYKAGPTSVRDEFKTVDYFLNVIDSSQKPFLAVYYSFVGHWPYPDSPEERLIPAESLRSRYINNLYAQDKLIRRIVTHLENSGKLRKTILVIVGDHGEAFYQHPGNRVHSAESYNENLASPLVVYAPGLITPERVDFPTVHADIVPTLLAALKLAYDPKTFQGESILRGKPKRRYVFSFGNENTITAIGSDLRKMQLLQTTKNCRYFDLAIDWAEKNNLPCPMESDHHRAITEFLRIQPSLLRSYNEFCVNAGC